MKNGLKNIHYKDTDNTIIINDDIKFTYLMYGISIVLMSISASIQLVNIDKFELSLGIIIWPFIGLFSLITGLFLLFKRTTQEKIPIKEIEGFHKKNLFLSSKYSIKLKNGKQRELANVKTKDQFTELQKMLENSGEGV